MATRLESFCNTTTDLQGIESNIDAYDRKRLVQNWQAYSGSVYVAYNVGFTSMAYVEGKELTMCNSLSDVNAADEAYYDSDADALYVYSLIDPDEVVYEASEDWATVKQRVVNEQADHIRSFINRPIFKRTKAEDQGAASRNYDFVLINANAGLACAALISSQDPDKAMEIYERYISPDGDGMLDRLKRGDYALWHEATNELNEGRVVPVSVNASSTGYIADTKVYALPKVDYDDVRVKITQAGTFTSGSASSVKYSVYIKNDDGLAMMNVVEDEVINGDYQSLAYGMEIRWSEGVYTLNDEYSIIVVGQPEEHGEVRSGQILRR
tara:strand:+ start:2776 stop:3750 length:975 start_codon:yes stop_codon:yes gene_type:complete